MQPSTSVCKQQMMGKLFNSSDLDHVLDHCFPQINNCPGPGRVDLMQLIDDATPDQARILFDRFYSEGDGIPDRETLDLCKTLVSIVRDEMKQGKRISMAALQGLFIRNKASEAV